MNKKGCKSSFFVLLGGALIGAVCVGIAVYRDERQRGHPVATLPAKDYECEWVSKDRLLCIAPATLWGKAPANDGKRCLAINVLDGSVDAMKRLNDSVRAVEIQNGVHLFYQLQDFSPDGKWLFTTPVAAVMRSRTGVANRRWLIRLDGTRQIQLRNNDVLLRWLPDSSGYVVRNEYWSYQHKHIKFPSDDGIFLNKLSDLNGHIPARNVYRARYSGMRLTPDGKKYTEVKMDFRPGKSFRYTGSALFAQVIVRNVDDGALVFEGAKVASPVTFDENVNSACLPSPDGESLLWVFELEKLRANSYPLLDRFIFTYRAEFYITNKIGGNIRHLPTLRSKQYLKAESIQWLPDSKRFSYMIDKTVSLVDFN